MNKRLINNFYFTAIVPIIVFWLLLYSCGYPPPSIDDLALTGAAIHLSQTGEYVNPWLAWWNERLLTRFFIQPPFYSYTLAAWLWLFGVSTRSLLFFNCVCYAVFSCFTALSLKRLKFPKTLALLIPLFFSVWMLTAGLRQEVLGMAFWAVGLWFLIRDRVFSYFCGFFFLGTALLCWPITIVYSFTFTAALLGCNFYQDRSEKKRYVVLRILALIAAIVVVFGILLLCIDFKIDLFLSDMAWHSSFRRQSFLTAIPDALRIVTRGYGKITYGSLYGLFIFLLYRVFRKRSRFPLRVKILVLVIVISLLLNIFVYASTISGIFNFFCWVGVAAIVLESELKFPTKTFWVALCSLVFLINNSVILIPLIGSQKGSEATYRQAREFVSAHPERAYVMDSYAVRLAFNYQPPVPIIDWTFSRPAPQAQPTSLADKPANVVYIVSLGESKVTEGFPDIPNLQLFGYEFKSFVRNPYDLIIID